MESMRDSPEMFTEAATGHADSRRLLVGAILLVAVLAVQVAGAITLS
jgi:hypothetical protein